MAATPKDVRAVELDATDRELLRVLQLDARIPNSELAARVGIAASTAHGRLRRLVDAGVIRGFFADVDPAAVGRPLRAMVAVSLQSDARGQIRQFVGEIAQRDEVIDVFFLAGADDYLLHVATADTEAGGVPSDLDPSRMLRPSASRDTEFFWEGVAAHELRIQKLDDGTLRHPPIPATWKPRLPDGTVPVTDYVVASGTGTVYSYVVHRAPKVPGRELPFVVALVELDGLESVDSGDSDDDGLPLPSPVRLLAELRDVDPADVHIGQRVEAMFLDFPADEASGTDAWTLYAWRPTAEETQ